MPQKRNPIMDVFFWSTPLLYLVAVLTVMGTAEVCVPIEGYNSCACRLNETKQVYNLVPLAPKNASERPRFTANQTTDGGWRYSYNPCDGFDLFVPKDNRSRQIPCYDVAVARWTNSAPHKCEDIGDPGSAVFDYTNTNLSVFNLSAVSDLMLIFTAANTVTKNEAVIYLVCNSNMTYLNESVFSYLSTDRTTPHLRYIFSLESRCGCPGLCGTPPKKGPSKGDDNESDDTWLIVGVSIGAILLLLLVILAVICCRTKRSGYTSV